MKSVQALADWRQGCEAYRAHFDGIAPRLSPTVVEFAKNTFHDGIVEAVYRISDSEIGLDINAWHNPWGRRGRFRIKFKGVHEVEGITNLVGDDWLYEEIHLHSAGAFEYRVFFWRSDFRVVADDVELEELV